MRVTFVSAIVIFLSLVLFPNKAYGVKTFYATDYSTQTEVQTPHSRQYNWSDELSSLSSAEPSLHTNERIDQLAPRVPEVHRETFDRISRVLKDRFSASILNIKY